MPGNETHRPANGLGVTVADDQETVLIMRAADDDRGAIRVIIAQGVTMAAIVGKAAVFQKRAFLKAGQLALVEAHAAPGVVGGMDLSIEEDGIDLLGRHRVGDRRVASPSAVLTLGIDLK